MMEDNGDDHDLCPQSNATIRTRRRNTNQTTSGLSSLRRKDGLIRYARNIRASQHGEDGILQHIFEHCLVVHDETTKDLKNNENHCQQQRYCVDVGAWDGKHLSNTYHLLVPEDSSSSTTATKIDETKRKSKWNGILIEANPKRYEECKNLHDPLHNVSICCEVSSTIYQRRLSTILKQFTKVERRKKLQDVDDDTQNDEGEALRLPLDFDFLSIDVDGCDYWLMEDILSTPITSSSADGSGEHLWFRPKVICVEFNPTIPHNVIYINPRNDMLRHGSSVSALVELAQTHQYTLVETTTYNAFFITNELYYKYIVSELPWCISSSTNTDDSSLVLAATNTEKNDDDSNNVKDLPVSMRAPTIEEVHELTMGTQLYQLYDGTLKLSGCQKLLWHRIPIKEEQIQMIQPSSSNQTTKKSFPFAPPSLSSSLPTFGTVTNSTLAVSEKKDLGKTTSVEDDNEEEDSYYNSEQYDYVRRTAVDLSPFCCGGDKKEANHQNKKDVQQQTKQDECAKRLIEQLLVNDGFVILKGLGISSQLCLDALRETTFFLQDGNGHANESIRRSALSKMDRARRGYVPSNTENFASLLDENEDDDDHGKEMSSSREQLQQHSKEENGKKTKQQQQKKGKPQKHNDIVRKFRIGPPTPSSMMDDNNNNSNIATSSCLYHENTWPDTSLWGQENSLRFRFIIEQYYIESCQASNGILHALCHGFQLLLKQQQTEQEQATTTTTSKNDSNSSDGSSEPIKHDIVLQQDYIDQLTKSLIGSTLSSASEELSSSSISDSNSSSLFTTTTNNNDSSNNNDDNKNGCTTTTTSTSILTLLGYKKGARHQGKCTRPLVAPHTDVGVFTLLLFDQGNCAVLQRRRGRRRTKKCQQTSKRSIETQANINDNKQKDESDEWIDVMLPPIGRVRKRNDASTTNMNKDDDGPYFVMNVGDCLSDMCGNVLPSALHRVMPRLPKQKQQSASSPYLKPTSTTRSGLALFVGLDSNVIIPLPNSNHKQEGGNKDDGGDSDDPNKAATKAGRVPSWTTMTYEDWRKERIIRATRNLQRATTLA